MYITFICKRKIACCQWCLKKNVYWGGHITSLLWFCLENERILIPCLLFCWGGGGFPTLRTTPACSPIHLLIISLVWLAHSWHGFWVRCHPLHATYMLTLMLCEPCRIPSYHSTGGHVQTANCTHWRWVSDPQPGTCEPVMLLTHYVIISINLLSFRSISL